MKKIMISVLGWSSVLYALLGACLLIGISARDITVVRVGAAILLFSLATCVNIIANRSGWDSPNELRSVIQFFMRLKATISNRFPHRTAQDGQSEKKRAFRLIRPPIRLRLYLTTTSLICLLFAIMLEMLEYIRGVPMFGHSMFDIAAYIFASLAAIPFVINILVIVGFFLRSVISFLRDRG